MNLLMCCMGVLRIRMLVLRYGGCVGLVDAERRGLGSVPLLVPLGMGMGMLDERPAAAAPLAACMAAG